MSRIIEMYGERADGVKTRFSESEVDKIRPEEFVSITVIELMTTEEVKEKYGK